MIIDREFMKDLDARLLFQAMVGTIGIENANTKQEVYVEMQEAIEKGELGQEEECECPLCKLDEMQKRIEKLELTHDVHNDNNKLQFARLFKAMKLGEK